MRRNRNAPALLVGEVMSKDLAFCVGLMRTAFVRIYARR